MKPLSSPIQILQSKDFSEFQQASLAFCQFVEGTQILEGTEFLEATRTHLILLYASALKLQWVQPKNTVDDYEKLSNLDMDKILRILEIGLDRSRYYWHVFDPTIDDNSEASCGDLLDDLGDIFRDLKSAIIMFELDKQDSKSNALWHFKFDFESHWGDHCINALKAIHFFLSNERSPKLD